MRDDNTGGRALSPWSDAQEAPSYAVGDTVYSGDTAGRVVSVGADAIGVIWSDGDSAIIYPVEATYLRKAYPWE